MCYAHTLFVYKACAPPCVPPPCAQAKRTNIGIALITSPRILFLDEVTSGLDSYNAHSVIRVVKVRGSTARHSAGGSAGRAERRAGQAGRPALAVLCGLSALRACDDVHSVALAYVSKPTC